MTQQAGVQLGLIKRTDQIDTRLMLLIAQAAEQLGSNWSDEQLVEMFNIPRQGSVTGRERLRQARDVVRFWEPSGLLMAALEFGAPWHSLVEAARSTGDTIAPNLLFTAVDDYLARKHAWPTVGELRKMQGRPSNHRLPGEQPDQEALAI